MKAYRSLLVALVLGVTLTTSVRAQSQDSSKAAAKQPAAGAVVPAAKVKIDINSASKDSLMTLKGIGEVYAAAIIKGRPYKRKDELVQRQIIPAATYAKIQSKIIATQSP
jgi:competence protein ComEA